MQGNWGCARLHPATDRASLEACGFAEAMRDFRKKDSKQYKKWLAVAEEVYAAVILSSGKRLYQIVGHKLS